MPKKDLNSLSVKDLVRRRKTRTKEIKALREQLAAATSEKKKKSIQDQIDKKKASRRNLNKIIETKEASDTDIDKVLNELYSSSEFQSFSDANQKMIKSIMDSYGRGDYRDLELSVKEVNNIIEQAREKVKSEYDTTVAELDLDREQALRKDVDAIEKLLERQYESSQSKTLSEERRMAIRNLEQVLSDAKSQYEVAAQRKNEYLQTQLEDIQAELETALTTASEDKIIELRGLERVFNSNLLDLQNNMAARGLAFSGIRAREEGELEDEYEDDRTTAELVHDRRVEEAERLAAASERDITTMTSQELEDLLTKYSDIQRDAIQGTEAYFGTDTTAGVLSGSDYSIGGVDASTYLYGDITGQQTKAEQETINTYLSDFESTYGTDALKERFDIDKYGYTPIGGVVGTSETQYERAVEAAEEERASTQSEIEDTLLNTKYYSKF